MEDKKYRHNVIGVILNSKCSVLWAERADAPGSFQFPQGGVDDGETEEIAMIRELSEELGTDNFEIVGKSEELFFYDFPDNIKKKFNNYEYAGQKQRAFLLRFTGLDEEINLDTEHKEFISFQWIGFSAELAEKVIEFKQSVYKKIYDEFKNKIKELKDKNA